MKKNKIISEIIIFLVLFCLINGCKMPNVTNPFGYIDDSLIDQFKDGLDIQDDFALQGDSHPSLLFDDADLLILRNKKEVSVDYWPELHNTAENIHQKYKEAMIIDPDTGDDIRFYADSLLVIALADIIDPDLNYDASIRDIFFKMLRYPNWLAAQSSTRFNNHDLTKGHFLLALSLTYDWHYDLFSDAEHHEIISSLAVYSEVHIRQEEKGWMESFDRPVDWFHYGKLLNNHYWINNSGVFAAGLVLKNKINADVSDRFLNITRYNFQNVISSLGDDGSSKEGVMYHKYGMQALIFWVELEDRISGLKTESKFIENSIDYLLYSATPGGDRAYGAVSSFADIERGGIRPLLGDVALWLAQRYDNRKAKWISDSLDERMGSPYIGFLWSDIFTEEGSIENVPNWHFFNESGIFIWRSSWDNDALYFSSKGGSNFGGHEHPDAGHFILENNGIPYITDSYYTYHKRTDNHNVIMVDHSGQKNTFEDTLPTEEYQIPMWPEALDPAFWADSNIIRSDDDSFYIIIDPTKSYKSEKLEKWERHLIFENEVLIVYDIIHTNQSALIESFLHSLCTSAPADPKKGYDYASMHQDNPFSSVEENIWQITPREGAGILTVRDISQTAWVAEVSRHFIIPNKEFDVEQNNSAYNFQLDEYQLGYKLRRILTVNGEAVSITAFYFGSHEVELQNDGTILIDNSIVIEIEAGVTRLLNKQ